MTKILIEKALRQIITKHKMHKATLGNGNTDERENKFTRFMASDLDHCWPQVKTKFSKENYKNIDLVKFLPAAPIIRKPSNIIGSAPHVAWGLEAKHYDPYQDPELTVYLNKSLYGPITDLLKLIDCRFKKCYILQLQTEIIDIKIPKSSNETRLANAFPFLNYMRKTKQSSQDKIKRVTDQDRIPELVKFSRNTLDSNLIYDSMPGLVKDTAGEVEVMIHYLISGPFYRNVLVNRLDGQGYLPGQSYETQAKIGNKVLQTNLHIESDHEE